MRDITNGVKQDDDDVVFYDGFLYIISRTKEGYIDENEYTEDEYSIDVLCLCPEYDEPITLKDIAEKYPKVVKVIYEDYMRGAVFNYGNHGHEPNAEMWEKTGETLGFV